MTRRLTRAEQQQRTRRRLMDTALGLFAERGLSGVSVDEVAEAAGYSRGAVYSNFESKQDLALTIMEDRIGQRATHLTDEIASNPNWWQPPDDGADTPDPWDLLFVELLSEAMRDQEVRSRLAGQLGRLTDAMVTGLVAAGLPPERARLVAPASVALINGMQTQYVLTGDERLLDAYRVAMTGLLAQDPSG